MNNREIILFWQLPASERFRITRELGLLSLEENRAPEQQRYIKAFDLARVQGKFETLLEKIYSRYLELNPKDVPKYKINFHCHSPYSDGVNSIAELAVEAKNLGHCSLVVTDHVYSLRSEGEQENSKESEFSMSFRALERQRSEASAISELSNFPIICGIELTIRGFEEVVVIGSSAIDVLYEIREDSGYISIEDLAYIKSEYSCVINLCHPGDAERFIAAGGHKVLDGYEVYNKGINSFEKRNKINSLPPETDPYASFGLVKLSNSDAHGTRSLYRCCNLVETPLLNEAQIIRYFKDRKSFVPHVNPSRERIKISEVF